MLWCSFSLNGGGSFWNGREKTVRSLSFGPLELILPKRKTGTCVYVVYEQVDVHMYMYMYIHVYIIRVYITYMYMKVTI